ncbi:MAG TPA: GNAT family protein, partial [Micromonosporaceae bacterium]|nr:GNAT family protein [Micromonosporaceae bacterium]
MIIVSNNQLALAELMPGDRETVDSQCDLTFDFDHDDRPVPWEITTQFAALLELPSAELIGYLCWRPIPYLPSLCGTTWNLGIELIPGGRGRGVGAAAGMLLIQHLFASTEVDRIQMIVEADNVPGWRALEKLGMHREGVLRQLGKRAGKR